MDWMPQAIREGLFVILLISGPLVILAAGLGLTIGILQAATQVQEQTLGSAVKIIGLFVAIITFGFYMFSYMKNYTEKNISRAFKLVPFLEEHPMPRKGVWILDKDPKEKELPAPELENIEPLSPKPPNMSLLGADAGLDEVPVNTGLAPESIPRPKMQESRPVQAGIKNQEIKNQTKNEVENKVKNKVENNAPVTPKPSPPASSPKPIAIPEAPLEATQEATIAPKVRKTSLQERLQGIKDSAIKGTE